MLYTPHVHTHTQRKTETEAEREREIYLLLKISSHNRRPEKPQNVQQGSWRLWKSKDVIPVHVQRPGVAEGVSPRPAAARFKPHHVQLGQGGSKAGKSQRPGTRQSQEELSVACRRSAS